MLSAYLTVCNGLKQFKDNWALNTKKKYKIGRNKSYAIRIPDEATSEIPKTNYLKITFSSDQIQIEYFNWKTLDKICFVQYDEKWKWFDCMCVIAKYESKEEEEKQEKEPLISNENVHLEGEEIKISTSTPKNLFQNGSKSKLSSSTFTSKNKRDLNEEIIKEKIQIKPTKKLKISNGVDFYIYFF